MAQQGCACAGGDKRRPASQRAPGLGVRPCAGAAFWERYSWRTGLLGGGWER